jgi:hypothetical protein
MKRVTFYPSVLETFNNLPFTEDTVHEYDVELIIQYLKEHEVSHFKMVVDYILKIVDNMFLIEMYSEKPDRVTYDKVTEICRPFSEIAYKNKKGFNTLS